MSKNIKLATPFLFHFLLALSLQAAPLKTLSLDFTRELTENDKTEHIIGTLHYDAKKARVVVEVTKPLKQIMVVKDKVLEIYYPCLLYTSPSPRDRTRSRMPSSA